MPDILATQADAEATLDSRDRRRSLSVTKHAELRAALLSDSYLFTKKVCKHHDLIPSVHMPLSYLACGLTDRLIETLQMPALDGYVTRALRKEFWRRQIDWTTAKGRQAIDELINGTLMRPAVINIRMFRKLFKSSTITHGGTLFVATVDPNKTIKITHAVDPIAWAFCEQIGHTVLSGTYRDLFPDRVPEGDLSKLISQKRITLGGRTISHPQTTIQASGYNTKDEAAHYDTFITDDLVTDLNSSPLELREVIKYMKRLTGFYMPTRPVRRIEVGTKHDEDDDDTRLSQMADCLTLRVPIEEYDHRVTNILERGKPTCPELFSTELITIHQQHVLSGAEDEDGYRVWWNQYLLSATGGTLRLFPPEVVDDPDRWWQGPFEHPNSNWKRRGHYLIARFRRTRDGRPTQNPRRPAIYDAEGNLKDDWRENAEIISYDPWADLDRAILVDPAWSDREFTDNWAVSCVGQDPDDVRFQLETLSDTSGIEGWIAALAYLDEKWHPRTIGFDGNATQDPMIQNLMRTDKRLRRIASRMVPVKQTHQAKPIRMQEGVAEPMIVYRYLLAPPYNDGREPDALGGNMTRSELKLIKSTPKHSVRTDQDGIADTLSMAGSVLRASRRKDVTPPPPPKQRYDPILGIPLPATNVMVVR
jgi:hypothetical protein